MEPSARRSALRIALTFFVITILLTLLYHVWESIAAGTWNPGSLPLDDFRSVPWHALLVEVRGGVLFAFATACVMYYLLGRELSAREQAERQRSEALDSVEELAAAASRQALELDAVFRSIADGVMVYDSAGRLVSANPAAAEVLGIDSGDPGSLDMTQPRFVHHQYVDVVPPEELPVARALRGETVRGERLACLTCEGEPRVMLVTAAPLVENGKPYGAVQVWHDVTERERLLANLEQRVRERTRDLTAANRLLEEQVETHTREFATLLDISRNLTSPRELRPLLDEIMDQLRALVPYDAGIVLAQQEKRLRVLSYRGPLSAEQVQALPSDASARLAYELVSKAGQAQTVSDVQMGGQLADSIAANGSQLMAGCRSWLGVPVVVRGRMTAVLCLMQTTANYYTEHHAALAQATANQAAVVIENARLYLEGLRAAALEERQRLALDLHDSVLQTLYTVVLDANSARELLMQDRGRTAELLDELLGLAEASLSEMRALIFELRPESLERGGLVPALGKLASALQARHGVPVFTDLADEPPLTASDKEQVYRIAQEALHNVARHGRAGRAGLRLYRDDGTVVLEVSDDGIGFDPARSFPGHLGLQSMRERAESIGGSLEVTSAKGQGTVVRARVAAS